MISLRIALVEISPQWNFSDKIEEAAELYKEGFVDKVYLLGGDFSRLYYAIKDCLRNGILMQDIINDEPNLPTFIKECDEGVHSLLVITSCLSFIGAWNRFRKYPKWVWITVKFHVASVL
jgi:hypothetical protein